MSDKDETSLSIEPVRFYAAILHADGVYNVEEFETLDALVARVKGLVDRDVSVFSFAGTRLQISKPPFRHLLTPWGAQPLFDPPGDNLEPDDSGYLGLDPAHLEDPPEVKAPTGPNRSTTPTNEFFSDDDENVVNVFDNILPDPDS
jgi:hypothetical protein